MAKDPLVTVLMAAYNGGRYLKSSIESVVNQSFRDFEFLIINDCSTDDSVKVIEDFNDARIVIHHNEKNIGQTKSLNVGLKLAKGKYIARMDADDLAFPTWLEKLVTCFEKKPEYAVIGAAAVVIDDIGKKKEIRRAPINLNEIIFRIFFAPPVNHVSVLMNKAIILKMGGYDEEFKITQDYELWSQLIRRDYSIINVPDILVSYRVHSQSIGFKETDKRGLQEKSETIFRNVTSLTDLSIRYDDAIELCKLFYHTHELTQKQFDHAENNFSSIYMNIKEKFKLPQSVIVNGIKKQMLKPYCKLAIFEVQNKRIKTARKIALEYCRKYGYHIMPFGIFLATYIGYKLSKKIPCIYAKGLEMSTNLFLKMRLS